MSQQVKMGRPKQTDDERQVKVDKIIQAAQSLFVAEGYTSVSMRKIAAKADMGTMTLYKYFPNKNAILHHIWAQFFDELFSLIRADVGNEKDAKGQLRKMCITYLNYWVEHKDRFHIVFLNEDRASSSDEFFINHTNVVGEMLVVIAPIMQDLVGHVGDSSVMVFLESLMCFVHGIALNVITIGEYPWNNYEKYIDIFLDATL
ncbi:TetR/AcrR family transcriptional regulator [Alcanivorax sp. 1008]|uniref:TetR/AcrR family transcriptional regulator n=1 Tax=Alcanivorax sp. 1008 TaxID=2816853 RepID=UPI001DCB0A63|nr:TetR/AcrR family transcriptional regulator [Alcanivorax sp. 1008]MCC1495235.1 TetR/AcrR family transcriptional regulator [Alcanivorax sp. 1008]